MVAGLPVGKLSNNPVAAGLEIGNPITGGSANQLLYTDSDGNLASSNKLTFDGSDFTVAANQTFTGTNGLRFGDSDPWSMGIISESEFYIGYQGIDSRVLYLQSSSTFGGGGIELISDFVHIRATSTTIFGDNLEIQPPLSLLDTTIGNTAYFAVASADYGQIFGVSTDFAGTDGVYAKAVRWWAEQPNIGDLVTRVSSLSFPIGTGDDPKIDTYQNRTTTTNGTTATLHTFSTTTNTSYLITAKILARRTGGTSGAAGDSATYVLSWGVKNVAGTVTAIGGAAVSVLSSQEDQGGWDATMDISGTSVRVRVTGAADNNITWHLVEFNISPLSS